MTLRLQSTHDERIKTTSPLGLTSELETAISGMNTEVGAAEHTIARSLHSNNPTDCGPHMSRPGRACAW